MKLIKVIYIGRHGERGPLKFPPELKQDWEIAGMLTKKGAESQYQKGQFLRKKYQKFLDEMKNKVLCQSSNMDRTIDSCYSLLNGLLGLPFTSPKTISKQEKVGFITKYGAKLKPLEFDVINRGCYGALSPGVVPLYAALTKSAYERKEHFELLEPIVPIASKMFEFDKTVASDLLECYQVNGMPFPKGFEDGKIFKQLEFMHFYLVYNLMYASDIARRISNHYIYKEIIKIMTSKDDPAFYYYSTHDTNVFGIILGLGYNINEMPIHSSGITIEVYESGDERFINLDYKEENLNKLIFPELVTDYIPIKDLIDKMMKECFKDDEEYKKYNGNKEFDYERDYANAKPVELSNSQTNEHKQLDTLFKKTN